MAFGRRGAGFGWGWLVASALGPSSAETESCSGVSAAASVPLYSSGGRFWFRSPASLPVSFPCGVGEVREVREGATSARQEEMWRSGCAKPPVLSFWGWEARVYSGRIQMLSFCRGKREESWEAAGLSRASRKKGEVGGASGHGGKRGCFPLVYSRVSFFPDLVPFLSSRPRLEVNKARSGLITGLAGKPSSRVFLC